MTHKLAIIFLGPPGSGKGTHARHLTEDYSIPVVGMGDLLREESKKDTMASKEMARFLADGEMIPWALTRAILEKKLRQLTGAPALILDGVPRTIVQANDLDAMLRAQNFDTVKVVHLRVASSVVCGRLVRRLVCEDCNAPFSQETGSKPACPFCASTAYTVRSDDNAESIKRRIAVHQKHMEPVLSHYQKKDLVLDVDASQAVGTIQEAIRRYIKTVL
jgi:adenylate kinase